MGQGTFMLRLSAIEKVSSLVSRTGAVELKPCVVDFDAHFG